MTFQKLPYLFIKNKQWSSFWLCEEVQFIICHCQQQMLKHCFLAEEYGRENWAYPTVNTSHTIRGTFHAQYLSVLGDVVFYGAECTVSMVYGDSLYEAVRTHTQQCACKNAWPQDLTESVIHPLWILCAFSFYLCRNPSVPYLSMPDGRVETFLFWNMVFTRFQLEV